MMKPSYRFFENKDCQYYPCHRGLEDFNCLFCYCPFFSMDHCPGKPQYKNVERCSGKKIKVCTECIYPHEPENYDDIIKHLKEEID